MVILGPFATTTITKKVLERPWHDIPKGHNRRIFLAKMVQTNFKKAIKSTQRSKG